MPVSRGPTGRGRLRELLSRVLPQQLMHVVAPIVNGLHERSIYQRAQYLRRGARNSAHCPSREPSAEDGQCLHHVPFPLREQAPRVVEHGPHTALSLWHVAQVGLQQVEARLELRCNLAGREDAHPPRCEQYAQRHAGDELADADHVPRVVVHKLEGGPEAVRALHK